MDVSLLIDKLCKLCKSGDSIGYYCSQPSASYQGCRVHSHRVASSRQAHPFA